jgi:lipopolysaccharide transport system ATP-binding protein
MSIAIRIEGLGKRYAINQSKGNGSSSIREVLARRLLRGRGADHVLTTEERGTARPVEQRAKEFWALRDVSFDGAGKSTLLKILSRVTSPTEGRISITGKVASLLEVGTGFHPELSGRENIYLNGAILGMTTGEIRKKFDQIVDFSGIEKFIDTPVKHYSSGMYVRLAFSAWLDPDILILDEVLAVGDQAFQKKCAERMKELTKEGRTVLFVSHSMATVNQMCQKALYLENGRVVSYRPVEEATVEYQRHVVEETEKGPWHRAEFTVPDKNVEIYSERAGEVECIGGAVTSANGDVLTHLPIEQPIHVTLRYRILKNLPHAVVPSFNFYDENGQIFYVSISPKGELGIPGTHVATCIVPPFLLNDQRFVVNLNLVSLSLANNSTQFAAVSALRFEVVEPPGADVRRHGWTPRVPGLIRPRLEWIAT